MNAPRAQSVPAPVGQVSPIDRVGGRRPAWDDTPLRAKVTLLVALATVVGCLVGILEVHLNHAIWPLVGGLSLTIVAVTWLGRQWVWRPVERLLEQLGPLSLPSETSRLAGLPLLRRDEVGQLARSVYYLTRSARRDHLEATRLRRTIDIRVEEATRSATHQLRQLAMRDPLTDLGNRRFLEENLEPLVQSVLASGEDLVCLFLDIDGFKQVNDTLGHPAGDELLIFLASLLRAAIRRQDYAVRLGGDEFALLIPGGCPSRAQEAFDRVATLYRQHSSMALPENVHTDLSAGIASLLRDGLKNGQALMERADANLYTAKRAGKGRAVGGEEF